MPRGRLPFLATKGLPDRATHAGEEGPFCIIPKQQAHAAVPSAESSRHTPLCRRPGKDSAPSTQWPSDFPTARLVAYGHEADAAEQRPTGSAPRPPRLADRLAAPLWPQPGRTRPHAPGLAFGEPPCCPPGTLFRHFRRAVLRLTREQPSRGKKPDFLAPLCVGESWGSPSTSVVLPTTKSVPSSGATC